MVGINK